MSQSVRVQLNLKPFDAVHHPDQSEDSQDEDDVQDLTAGVVPRCNRTGTVIQKDRWSLLCLSPQPAHAHVSHRKKVDVATLTSPIRVWTVLKPRVRHISRHHLGF